VVENQCFSLRVDRDKGIFDILSQSENYPSLVGNVLEIIFRDSRGRVLSSKLSLAGCQEEKTAPDSVMFAGRIEKCGLEWTVEFNLKLNPAFMMWRVSIANVNNTPVWIEKIILLSPEFEISSNLEPAGNSNAADLSFFSNGWQSWSYSGAYQPNQKMRRSRLGILQEPMVINPGTPVYKKPGRFSSDFFGVLADQSRKKGLLVGFLSQKQHFGTIAVNASGENPQLEMWANGDFSRLDPGCCMRTDWALVGTVDFEAVQPLEPYLDAVADEHQITDLPESPVGWCSWYYYYQDISEKTIRGNLKRARELNKELPLQVFQIDDGFQTKVGDWFSFSPGFPDGTVSIAADIKSAGMKPGIWLAPFILEPGSLTAREHPEWLLRTAKGNPVRTGFVWNSLGAALDITIPEALNYACEVVRRAVEDWGFEYLKLDFLYAAALQGVYSDSSKTRAQVMRTGLEALREAAGENTFLVGCGAPLGSVLGLVDAMRISADVSGDWKPGHLNISFPFRNEPHMPSARNAIQNIITRAPFHGKWWINDPDCLLVRTDSNLTLAEIQALATAISLSGGSIFISDDLTALEPERIELASFLLPPMNQAPRILDWINENTPGKMRIDLKGKTGKWSLLAYFNWQDSAQSMELMREDFSIPERDCLVRSVWNEKNWLSRSGSPLYRGNIDPHGVILLAIRDFPVDEPVYSGGNIHISQGLEIKFWRYENKRIEIEVDDRKKDRWHIDLYSPEETDIFKDNKDVFSLERLGDNFFRIHCLEGSAKRISLELK
jgi:alpha-galactosidase